MKGRSLFIQPDVVNLKKISDNHIENSFDVMLKKLTGNKLSSQGIVTLNTMYDRNKIKDVKVQKDDKLNDYV